MGASLNNRNRGGRNGRYMPMAEINVTPFVDVMLVLLVVFILTARLLLPGIPVELPQTKAKALGEDKKPLSVTIEADGGIFIQENEIELDVLVERLRAIGDVSADTRIYVRADKSVDYGRVAEVIGTINEAGFNRVGLVTDKVKQRSGGGGR